MNLEILILAITCLTVCPFIIFFYSKSKIDKLPQLLEKPEKVESLKLKVQRDHLNSELKSLQFISCYEASITNQTGLYTNEKHLSEMLKIKRETQLRVIRNTLDKSCRS